MARKMLNEERELREWYVWDRPDMKKKYFADITALIHAVREDCAKDVERIWVASEWKSHEVRKHVADYIRGKK